MDAPVTRIGKSSRVVPVIKLNPDAILPPPPEWIPVPLSPEPMRVHGARRWLDTGRPENVEEYKELCR